MKIFLTPTDFSKSSDNALRFAIELAKKENSKILLLHVLTHEQPISEMPGSLVSEHIELAKRKAKEKLQTICNEINTSKNVQCEYIHKTGNLFNSIVETIKSIKPHLIVMGTKRKNNLSKKPNENCTLKLLKQTDHPMIAVPEHLPFTDLKKITFATDYRVDDKTAIKILIDAAKPFGAQINSLHIADGKANRSIEMEMLKRFSNYISEHLQYHNLSFQLIQGKEVGKELHKHLKENTPDIIAISNSNFANNTGLVCNDITKELLSNGKVPLFIIPGKEKNQLVFN